MKAIKEKQKAIIQASGAKNGRRLTKVDVVDRLFELAKLPPEQTRHHLTGQLKAMAEIEGSAATSSRAGMSRARHRMSDQGVLRHSLPDDSAANLAIVAQSECSLTLAAISSAQQRVEVPEAVIRIGPGAVSSGRSRRNWDKSKLCAASTQHNAKAERICVTASHDAIAVPIGSPFPSWMSG